ncbi:hypothetical protein A0H81_03325 [Grifola frondosa]|uniref:Uncharacterized protein n=1 Tax=Grifola frondosa TaxID=5627 RepID=A0A1C7MIR7_GRIFR|nr:hypothetical protein A0H81_03325 [Grifola frondosa]
MSAGGKDKWALTRPQLSSFSLLSWMIRVAGTDDVEKGFSTDSSQRCSQRCLGPLQHISRGVGPNFSHAVQLT